MTEPMRMEEDQSHMTERILNLTLEIIYLLTGESFPLLKCGEQLNITVPPCDSLKPERDSMQKILEVTQKMMELLTGESDYKAEVKKEIKVEDGVMVESSSYNKPPKRCPHLLYSQRDPTEEDLTIPRHQNANLRDHDIIVKEEYKEEDEEYGVMKEPDKGPKDAMEPLNKREPPERCPRPQDPTQEDLTIPQGDLIIVKVEGEEDETEDTPTQISTGCKMEDEDLTRDGGPSNPSEQPRTVRDGARKTFSCAECGKCCRSELGLSKHEKSHLNETFHPCPDCGKRFKWKSELITHQRSHTGEKPYTCSECGNSFTRKSSLVEHEKLHRGEKPFSCPECGKCFINKYGLSLHQRTHTGEKPYACEECGKCFPTRARLCKHQRIFPGDRPHFCLICGKCFARKTCYTAHQISHTQENPASSS